MIPEVETPEQLVAVLQKLLEQRRFDTATDLVRDVNERFPESPVAHHAAGLAWERTWIESRAEGGNPPLSHYEKAEAHYRRAMDLDSKNRLMHGERLFACVFVMGTQGSDTNRLREAVKLADKLGAELPETKRESLQRDAATAASALARVTRSEEDWADVAQRFDELRIPEDGGREAYFHHHYHGMARRELARLHDSQSLLQEAIDSFRQALALSNAPALEYLLADCLLQLQNPVEAELNEARELVAGLREKNPKDPLVEGVTRRLALRTQMQEKGGS